MSRLATPAAADGLGAIVDWIGEQTGLDFDGCHRERMTATVHQAFRAARVADHETFVEMLQRDAAAFEALADGLTIGETYFFREPAHFGLLRTTIVPERLAEHDGAFRVWSAGCASGEEPYSVAITLDELGVLGESLILGTDLSARALAGATKAVYGNWSLRRCDDDDRRRWFHPVGRRFRLAERYRTAVRWRAAGLLDGPPAHGLDLVLCRNVLLYLSPGAVQAAAEILHDSLATGGWLLVGASDPLLEHPGLERIVGPHGVAYRRQPETAADLRPPAAEPAPAERAPARARPPAPRTAIRPATATEPVRRPPRDIAASPDVAAPSTDVEPAGALDGQRRCEVAAAALESGDHRTAAREAAAAQYLEPGLVAAPLIAAYAAELDDDVDAAIRWYRAALPLLGVLAEDELVPVIDEPAGQVVRGVRSHLDRLAHRR